MIVMQPLLCIPRSATLMHYFRLIIPKSKFKRINNHILCVNIWVVDLNHTWLYFFNIDKFACVCCSSVSTIWSLRFILGTSSASRLVESLVSGLKVPLERCGIDDGITSVSFRG